LKDCGDWSSDVCSSDLPKFETTEACFLTLLLVASTKPFLHN
jgi:hypothetical protein